MGGESSFDSQPIPGALRQKLEYWQHKLAHAPAVLELPTDYPRPAKQSGQCARTTWLFGESRASAIQSLGRSLGTSPESLLLAAFSLLLSRYSGQTDIIVGFSASETNSALEAPAVLRSDLAGDISFVDVARQTQTSLDEARNHGVISLGQLSEALGLQKNDSHSPVVQALCIIPSQDSHGTQAYSPPHAASGFDLVLHITDLGTLSGHILYNTDLYKPETADRIGTHLAILLDNALSGQTGPANRLGLISSQEYQQIIFDWNSTTADFPTAPAHQMFEQQVERTPDAPAVVFDEQRLTYRELNERGNQLAHFLIRRGIKPDALVGVCVKRSLDMVIALLGILKAGGAYIPLDPAYPADRLRYMIEDARPVLLLAQESLLELLQKDHGEIVCLDRDLDRFAGESIENPAGKASASDLAYVIYTSGSTGRPKGVALEHRGLSNLCVTQAEAFAVDETSQVLQFASISFDAAVSETFVTLTKGACLHIIRQEALRSAYEITSQMEKAAISVVTLPPSLLAVLPRKPLPALKTLVLAGEAWSPELARIWAPGRRLLNAYGPTEGTVCATWHTVDASIEHTVPIGRPLANVKVYILDQHLLPTPIGVPGELYIAGPNLARGYLHRPDLTAERFIPNPFSADYCRRMYKTGDKVRYLADGNIEFLGRIDNQVKLRGYRIELGEIESALMTHDAIDNAVVIVREDHPGEKRLVAYVIGLKTLDIRALRAHLKTTLPDYMVPQNFILLDELPMSPNGKIDRKALPAPAAPPL